MDLAVATIEVQRWVRQPMLSIHLDASRQSLIGSGPAHEAAGEDGRSAGPLSIRALEVSRWRGDYGTFKLWVLNARGTVECPVAGLV